MGYDAKVRLGRQGTSKRDALVQVPEVHEGAGPVAGRVKWLAPARTINADRRSRLNERATTVTISLMFQVVCKDSSMVLAAVLVLHKLSNW